MQGQKETTNGADWLKDYNYWSAIIMPAINNINIDTLNNINIDTLNKIIHEHETEIPRIIIYDIVRYLDDDGLIQLCWTIDADLINIAILACKYKFIHYALDKDPLLTKKLVNYINTQSFTNMLNIMRHDSSLDMRLLLKSLIAAGLNINRRDPYNDCTVLNYILCNSVMNDHDFTLFKILIRAGADIHDIDIDHRSALFYCMCRGEKIKQFQSKICKLLMKYGAVVTECIIIHATDTLYKCMNKRVHKELSMKIIQAGGYIATLPTDLRVYIAEFNCDWPIK